MERLRIAMIGLKAIPGVAGGVETHVEAVATRLAAMGHEVWVYCRERFRPTDAVIAADPDLVPNRHGLLYRGVQLVYRRSVNTKHLDASSHSFVCALETALRPSFDIVHFHGIGPSSFAFIPRLAGRRVVTTLHALDWRQVKWGRLAKRALKAGEAAGLRASHGIIAVSRLLVDHIRERHGRAAVHIPNGAALLPPRPPRLLERLGLGSDDYLLTVGRIIRDRGLHHLIEAHRGLPEAPRLVMVGSEQPRTAYSDELEALGADRVIFTGNLFGTDLQELYAHCRLYVLASLVEGLPITVCEAMSFGRCTLLSDIPENREVGGDAALYFAAGNVDSLRAALGDVLADPDLRAERGAAARARIEAHFDWDRIAEAVAGHYGDVLNS